MTALDHSQSAHVQRAVAASLHDHSNLYIAEGLLMAALGLVAVLVPPIATLTIELLVGSLFLVTGVVGLVTTFQFRGTPGLWWSLLSAILAVAVGAVLLLSPVQGAISLTVILIAYFWMEGIASIVFSLDQRTELPSWAWLLVNGVIDIILGSMIFFGLPSSAAWAIGLLVGINLIFGGITLIALAMGARNLVPAPLTRSVVK